jgi:hypothetical protein
MLFVKVGLDVLVQLRNLNIIDHIEKFANNWKIIGFVTLYFLVEIIQEETHMRYGIDGCEV